jgi:hypothetical protein
MKPIDDQAIRAAVRDHYASVVKGASKEQRLSESGGGGCCAPTCCGETTPSAKEEECCSPSCCDGNSASVQIGYSAEELANVPLLKTVASTGEGVPELVEHLLGVG